MSEVNYLDDGYLETIDIAADEGKHGPLHLEFKPCLPQQVNKALDALERGNVEYFKAAIPIVAVQIKKWDLTDRNGVEIPISPASLERVARPLLLKIFDAVILGHREQVEADLKN